MVNNMGAKLSIDKIQHNLQVNKKRAEGKMSEIKGLCRDGIEVMQTTRAVEPMSRITIAIDTDTVATPKPMHVDTFRPLTAEEIARVYAAMKILKDAATNPTNNPIYELNRDDYVRKPLRWYHIKTAMKKMKMSEEDKFAITKKQKDKRIHIIFTIFVELDGEEKKIRTGGYAYDTADEKVFDMLLRCETVKESWSWSGCSYHIITEDNDVITLGKEDIKNIIVNIEYMEIR